MTKIHHFVNLVFWEEIVDFLETENSKGVQHVVYCDTWSMYFLLKLFRISALRISGIDFLAELSSKIKSDFLILCSGKVELYSKALIKKLPKKVDLDYIKTIDYIDNKINIVIGISSPKQNIIAKHLALTNPNLKNIFCLGAAVDLLLVETGPKNFNFIDFLRIAPYRTLIKIFLTIKNLILIVLLKNKRKKFINLASKL